MALEEVAKGDMKILQHQKKTKSSMNINSGKMLQERQCTVQWKQL